MFKFQFFCIIKTQKKLKFKCFIYIKNNNTMLSQQFTYTIQQLLNIINDNNEIFKNTPSTDIKKITVSDMCQNCNYINQLFNFLTIDNNFTDNGKNIIKDVICHYDFIKNGGKIENYQTNATKKLDILPETDKNILIKYLNIFDNEFKFELNDNLNLNLLHVNYIFAPLYFKKIMDDPYNSNNVNFFQEIDNLRGEKKYNNGNLYYREYINGIEKSPNLIKIIKLINDTKKYSNIANNETNETKNKIKKTEKPKEKSEEQSTKKITPKKQKIPAALRNAVWITNIGDKDKNGKCYCCKIESITTGNFECGHIIAEKEGGLNEINNLKPVCSLCNKSMGKQNMNDFIKKCGFK